MILGQVVAEVVATKKHPGHDSLKLLIVTPLDLKGEDYGAPVLAVDSVDAGVGDQVLLITDGSAAMAAVNRPQTPIDAAIVGIVDQVDMFEPESSDV